MCFSNRNVSIWRIKPIKKESPVNHEKTRTQRKKYEEGTGEIKQENTDAGEANGMSHALMWVDKYMPASTKQIIGQQVRDQRNYSSIECIHAAFINSGLVICFQHELEPLNHLFVTG